MRRQIDPTGIIIIFTNGDSLFLVNMFVNMLDFRFMTPCILIHIHEALFYKLKLHKNTVNN